jgi:hypothetical protein
VCLHCLRSSLRHPSLSESGHAWRSWHHCLLYARNQWPIEHRGYPEEEEGLLLFGHARELPLHLLKVGLQGPEEARPVEQLHKAKRKRKAPCLLEQGAEHVEREVDRVYYKVESAS